MRVIFDRQTMTQIAIGMKGSNPNLYTAEIVKQRRAQKLVLQK